MWIGLLALALLMLPAPALAGVREEVAALPEATNWWHRTLMSPNIASAARPVTATVRRVHKCLSDTVAVCLCSLRDNSGSH